MAQNDADRWFVLRFPAQNLPAIQNLLNENGRTSFSPVTFVADESGRTVRTPVLPGHIFVQGPQDRLDEVKREYEGDKLKYIMDNKSGKPLTFSDAEMQNFMQVAKLTHEGIEFLDARREINVKHGPMVTVLAEGPFKGVKGEYLRVRSNRCVVVRLGGLVTVATAFIKPDEVKQV